MLRIDISLKGHGLEGLQHQTKEPKQVPGPSPNLVSFAYLFFISIYSCGVIPTSFNAFKIGHGLTGGQQKANPLTSPPLQICDGAFSHRL